MSQLTIEEKIADTLKKKGITIRSISKATGISENILYPSFSGRRPLRADEFFLVCDCINANPNDFKIKKGA